MGMRCYLAMTAAEYESAETMPQHMAWMACHFSSYGLGLSNLPQALPQGSMVILNDRTPVVRHDPELILKQLSKLVEIHDPSCFLLDLQRSGQTQTVRIARLLAEQLPCPVGISQHYADGLSCPVFLPPPPLHRSLKEYLKPWQGRPIWLEAALTAQTVTVTKDGSCFEATQTSKLPEPFFCEEALHCCYHIDCKPDAAVFTLQRDKAQLEAMMEEAESLGVELAVGLYQQLG